MTNKIHEEVNFKKYSQLKKAERGSIDVLVMDNKKVHGKMIMTPNHSTLPHQYMVLNLITFASTGSKPMIYRSK